MRDSDMTASKATTQRHLHATESAIHHLDNFRRRTNRELNSTRRQLLTVRNFLHRQGVRQYKRKRAA